MRVQTGRSQAPSPEGSFQGRCHSNFPTRGAFLLQTPANKQDVRSQRDMYRHANPQRAGLWIAWPQINLPPVDRLLVCSAFVCVCT